jgi:hypothetical protein
MHKSQLLFEFAFCRKLAGIHVRLGIKCVLPDRLREIKTFVAIVPLQNVGDYIGVLML